MDKINTYPFKESSGEFNLPYGSIVQYCINTDGTLSEPVSLTFTAFNADRTPKNSRTVDSTLYFDTSGKITGRAPMQPFVNARKLKEMYAGALLQSIAIGSDEYKSISGFFEAGDAGIRRESTYLIGKIRKTLNRQDL